MALRHRDVDGDRQEDGDIHRNDRPGPTTASADTGTQCGRDWPLKRLRGRKKDCSLTESDPVTHLSSTTLFDMKAPIVTSETKTYTWLIWKATKKI